MLSGFAIFTLGFSHLTFSQSSMTGMEAMANHPRSSVQCQILCTTAIKTGEQGILTNLENEAKDPLPVVTLLVIVSLSFLAVTFIVKRLHLMSSWRPPDRILLCGHFADGL
jgi:hypothetical protein